MSKPFTIKQIIIETEAEEGNNMTITVSARTTDGTIAVLHKVEHAIAGDTLVISFGEQQGIEVFSSGIKVQ